MAVLAGPRAQHLLADAHAAARAAGLRWTAADEPGLHRKRRGRGFAYLDEHGRTVRDRATLDRIRGLAIPPAWTDVWIATDPRDHLQAYGRDARRRKQFRYHPKWRAIRDRAKFGRMSAFGRALPALRARVARDLRCPCLCRARVCAGVVALMDRMQLRVGGDEYARANRSHGAATLTDREVTTGRGGRVHLHFVGKSGVHQDAETVYRPLAALIAQCRRLPGARLFQYPGPRGGVRAVTSRDVNQYLHELTGGRFSAKDFRTWHASALCARLLPHHPGPSVRARKHELAEVIERVAEQLGNTPAVCRRSYIDPLLIDRYLDGHVSRRG